MNEPDAYESFLSGGITARRLLRHEGLSEALSGQKALANRVVSLLHHLQDAHRTITRDTPEVLSHPARRNQLADEFFPPADPREP